MTQLIVLYLATMLPFLALDAAMLSTVIAPLFRQSLGAQVLDAPRLFPAALFYLGYGAGVLHFAALPAFRGAGAGQALAQGALLGALAYGTYELTNLATLRDWTLRMTVTDLVWGAVLTGISCAIGVAVTRWLYP
jgi:uncharacterized membrane protein